MSGEARRTAYRIQALPPSKRGVKIALVIVGLAVIGAIICQFKLSGAEDAYWNPNDCPDCSVLNDAGNQAVHDDIDTYSNLEHLCIGVAVIAAGSGSVLFVRNYLRTTRAQCSSCRKVVKTEATVCPYCRSEFHDINTPSLE